jgi:hypothetical protein
MRSLPEGYVPSPVDPSTQAAQALVVVFAFIALPAAWWLVVVPTSRKKLATDKRKGASLQSTIPVLWVDHAINR